MIKVSIIMPVYNCEAFLEQCLASVLQQTLQEIEVVCIDDGSTDQSADIIRKFALEDERVILLQQSNQGAGKARNWGIEKAKGSYIVFLDADDFYIESDALEKMYGACEKNHLEVCGSLRKKIENGTERKEEMFEDMLTGKEEIALLAYENVQIDYNYQSFLFSRDLLLKNNIFFPPYLRFQDPPFLVKALHAAKTFAMVRTYLYCYRVPNMACRYNTRKTIDLLHGLIDNLLFADAHKLDILFQRTVDRIEYDFANMICHTISAKDINIIKLLLQANEIICKKYENQEYIIRPLQKILSQVEDDRKNYELRLLERTGNQERFAIYGAGGLARKFLKYLERQGRLHKVSYVIVSKPVENGANIEGIPIIAVEEVLKKESIFIWMAVGANYHKEILANLQKNNIAEYEIIDDVFLNQLP